MPTSALPTGEAVKRPLGSRDGRALGSPGSGRMCLFFQVKINSRGLVYSVVLLLGSVALTVSSYNSERKPRAHFVSGAPAPSLTRA